MATEKKSPTWLKDLLVAFAATTLSIILTFGTTGIINRVKQKQERNLTALMVMSNIESFARNLEESADVWDRIDSIAVWLLRLPIEDVAKLGDEPFDEAFIEVFGAPAIMRDKTAETIFSSNIETWKNMGNFQFIDNVGGCFSQMNWIEEQYKIDIQKYRSAQARVFENPDAFPGNSLAEKQLRYTQLRQELLEPNGFKGWLRYCADYLRKMNQKNMKLIGISEKEVMEFTDARSTEDADEEESDYADFRKPFPAKDSIDAHLDYARTVDSLLRKGGN